MKKFKRKVLAMLMTNNFGSSLRQQLFDGAPFCSELLHTAIPQRAASGTTATFTRATTATVQNNDGYLVTALAGEARFEGARRVRNLIPTTSEDYSNAVWTKGAVTVGDSIANPVSGSVNALKIKEDNTSADHRIFVGTVGSLVVGNVYVYSFYAKAAERSYIRLTSASGALMDVVFNLGTGAVQSNVAGVGSITSVAGGWYRCSVKATATVATTTNMQFRLQSDATTTSYAGTTGSGAYAWGAQLEDVTAQTTQTAGEYVSVGALDYRSDKDPLYLSLPGTAGHYASTPDSATVSITGDIDIRVKLAMSYWAPATSGLLVEKLGTVGQRSYDFWVVSTGVLEFRCSIDGTTVLTATGGTVTGFANGTTNWVRATRVASTGVVQFFTSPDGVTWSQLGADKSTTAGAMFDSTTQLDIGANSSGGNFLPASSIYRAQIYNGIDGTLAVDFNPHRDATTPTGTITSSTTGEVWTLNGASSVIRSAAYHGSMVDGVKCFPTDLSGNPIPSTTMLGYQAEGARTNLCLRSGTIYPITYAAAWAASGSITVTEAARIAPDGTVTATRVQTTGASSLNSAAITVTASTAYVFSFWALNNSGTDAKYRVYNNTGAADIVTQTTYLSSINNATWVRISVAFTTPVGCVSISVYPHSTGASGGDLYVWGAQLETGSFASSYIATTTIAVARNADVLTYSSAGNIDGTKGAAYAEVTYPRTTTTASPRVIDTGSLNGIPLYLTSSTRKVALYDGTAAREGAALTLPTSSPVKIGSAWGGASSVIALSGVATAAGFDGSMTTTSIQIGVDTGNVDNELNGTIRNVRIWQRALSSAELQAITS